MKTELILLRHGQPKLENRLLGHTDIKLSDLGFEQMKSVTDNLTELTLVVSSPLIRCANFAKVFAQSRDLFCEIDEQWQECHFGDWDGLEYEELARNTESRFSSFIDRPESFSPPNGERLKDFSTRVENAILAIEKRYRGQRILLVTHSGVIRMLVAWCLQINRLSNIAFQHMKIDYASLTQIDLYQADGLFSQLVCLNSQKLPSEVC